MRNNVTVICTNTLWYLLLSRSVIVKHESTPPWCRAEDYIYAFCWTEQAQASQESQTKAIHKHLAAPHSDERCCMSSQNSL